MGLQKETGKQTYLLTMMSSFIMVLGCLMVLYHLVSSQTVLFSTFTHQSIHLGAAIALVCCSAIVRAHTRPSAIVAALTLVAGVGSTIYVIISLRKLQMITGFPEPLDVAVGIVLIVAVVEATRRSWGITLPLVVSVFVGYFFLGHLLPDPLHHRQFSIDYVVSYLSVGLTGIYGSFLSISAHQIFLFVVFGSMFKVLGIEEFLAEAGKIIGRRTRSGPAQTAVVSSSLVGMITGASVANVAVTGAFTIPYMKKRGYSPELAGAIESTASTGGQLMPPVMGAAAFLMAFFIGIPYADVMLLGILPAILFYIGVMTSVHFASVKSGIMAPTEKADYRVIFSKGPAFIIPLGVIVTLLLNNYSPDYAAFWAIVSALVIVFARTDRPALADVAACLAQGALIGAKIAVSLAVVGMVAQTLITTGLGARLVGLVEVISAGNLAIALCVTMIVSIILGCGVPPAAAYSIVAITAAPALVRMGISPVSAHFFVFYFAIMSAVTPPVALGALAASALSGGRYLLTSVIGFKLAIAGFVIPFFIVFNPIMRFEVERLELALGALVAMPVSIISVALVVFGCGIAPLSKVDRMIAGVAALASFLFMTVRQFEDIPLEFPMLGIMAVAFGFVGWRQIGGLKRAAVEPGVSAS